ncbi:MAG: hypothetical protein ACJARP_001750 [Vicingaceae bacterium]|jgi:hypothetical protein
MNSNISCRNVILIVITVVSSFRMAQAQEGEFKYGTRIGLGESQLNFSDISGESNKLALSIGIASTYQFNDIIGVSADFLFTSKGGKRDGVETTSSALGFNQEYEYTDKYRLFYAELPLALTLRVPLKENFYLRGFGGPSINFKVLGTEDRLFEDDNFNDRDGYSNRNLEDLETVDYSYFYGLGVEVVGNDDRSYLLDFRLNQALGTAGEINNTEVENSYFLISASCLF